MVSNHLTEPQTTLTAATVPSLTRPGNGGTCGSSDESNTLKDASVLSLSLSLSLALCVCESESDTTGREIKGKECLYVCVCVCVCSTSLSTGPLALPAREEAARAKKSRLTLMGRPSETHPGALTITKRRFLFTLFVFLG